MADIAQELLRLKNHIEKAKTEKARVEGQIQQLETQRANDFGCSTDEEAEAYIAELQAQCAQLETDIQAGLESVKEGLGW